MAAGRPPIEPNVVEKLDVDKGVHDLLVQRAEANVSHIESEAAVRAAKAQVAKAETELLRAGFRVDVFMCW